MELDPGVRGLAAYIAYVVDPSLGHDETFDVSTVDWVATGQIDDADTASQIGDVDQAHAEPRPAAVSTAATRRAVERLVHSAEATVEQFRRSLDDALATLATLAGTNLGPDIPQSKEVQARGHSPGRGPT
jgi:hypothetical protein